MKFRNPKGDIIEGRLPRKDEGFYEDRYYAEIENVFVRFDPKEKHIRVVFPCSSESMLKIPYDAMESLAQKEDVTILDLIKSAYNVDEVTDICTYGYSRFSEDHELYILYNRKE